MAVASDQTAVPVKLFPALAVGQEAEAADSHEAPGQDVAQETAPELLQGHDPRLAAVNAWSRANDLNPMLTSHELPHLLLWMGRRDEAWAAMQRLEKQCDPLSAEHHTLMAHLFYWYRDFDRTVEEVQRAKEIDPVAAADYLVEFCYEATGQSEKALEVFLSGKSAEQETEYRRVFRESGMQGVRRRELEFEGAERLKPYDRAAYYALAGEKDVAFEWLNGAYDLPVFVGFFTDARFDSLRDDPRYEKLLHKLNLPEEVIASYLSH